MSEGETEFPFYTVPPPAALQVKVDGEKYAIDEIDAERAILRPRGERGGVKGGDVSVVEIQFVPFEHPHSDIGVANLTDKEANDDV